MSQTLPFFLWPKLILTLWHTNRPGCTLEFEFLSAWPLSALCLFCANIECMNHDVTDSYFNKRQTEIRFQHPSCRSNLCDCGREMTALGMLEPLGLYSSCVTSPPWCRRVMCMLMLIRPAWQRLISWSSMAGEWGTAEKYRDQICLSAGNLWTDLTPLTADLCPEKNKMSCILANSFLGLFSLPWQLYLSSQGDGIHQIREALKILAERVLILETMIGIHGE